MNQTTAPAEPRGLLHTLGLHRPELRAWALYDWANSAFVTTIGAAIFPLYYASVAGADLPGNTATSYLAYTNSIALLIIAAMAPVLGAMADYMAAKKRFLGVFMGLGVLATTGLFLVQRGDWVLASALFIVGSIGLTGSIAFADSLLPHIATQREVDRVSTAGYALGYFGGGILLVINAIMIAMPERLGLGDRGFAVRVVFLTVAAWWLLFSLPLFLKVPEPARRLEADEGPRQNPVRVGARRLRETFSELRQYRHAFKFLLAYWLFIDGIHSIQKLAAVYGYEIGIDQNALIGALIVAQFVGIPFTFAFGALAARIGPKRGIYLGLIAYTFITGFAYFVTEAWQFWALAFAVGMVQGGTQGLSRSLYASMIPKAKSSEFFSFFSIFEKFAGIMGPAIFGLVGQLTGTSRLGILALVVFFLLGMLLLRSVDVAEGRRAAAEEDAATRIVPPSGVAVP